MNVPAPIRELLEEYLDGVLAAERLRHLEAWIGRSDEHAAAAASWLRFHVELTQAARVERLYEVAAPAAISAATPRVVNTFGVAQARSRRRDWRYYAGIAASLACVAAALLFGAERGGESVSTPTAKKTERTPAEAVATVSRIAQGRWDAGSRTWSLGQDIHQGEVLSLKAGLVQVTFGSGAEVVIKGPSRFQVDGPMRGLLYDGSVTATVPRQASGFTIRSPHAEVIDLGTEFGFSVAKSGDAQVHVFKGEVISQQLDEHGAARGEPIRLTANEAAFFPGSLKKATRMAADEARFARTIPPLWHEAELPRLPVIRDLVFWVNAAFGTQLDGQQRVIAWQDLTVSDNRTAEDAFQPEPVFRPVLIDDAINGQPALRFDGMKTHLSTTPMTTTDNQTIVAVFQYSAANGPGGQLINYNGPPSRYLATTFEPGVLQLGERVGDRRPAPTSVSAKAYSGRESGADISTGWLTSGPVGHGVPTIAAYVYNNARNTSTLFINGLRMGDSSARTPVAINSRKVIGKHGIFDQWYFAGDLAELMIYNAALDEREIKQLCDYLRKRYIVPPTASPVYSSTDATNDRLDESD